MHRVINKQHKVNWAITENKAQLGLSDAFLSRIRYSAAKTQRAHATSCGLHSSHSNPMRDRGFR